MNSQCTSNKKFKYNFLRKININNPKIVDATKIINLIKEEYGDNYPEPQYYNKDKIKKIICRASKEKNIIWKCAFFNGELIGQALLQIIHNIGYIKFTIIKEKYRGQGILTLLGYHLANEIKKFSASQLLYIYAIVDNNNVYVRNFIEKYGFKKIGTTPYWDENKFYIIYGRNSFNNYEIWKIIKIHKDLFEKVYQFLINSRTKRYIQVYSPPKISHDSDRKLKINFSKCYTNSIPSIVLSLDSSYRKKGIAVLKENLLQKSWYNFQFLKDVSLDLKSQSVSKLRKKFYRNNKINSLSILVNINDIILQEILLTSGFRYYGYMPYFFMGIDYILMGMSKIVGL